MKGPKEQKMITKQVSHRLEELRPLLEKSKGISSWINYLRLGLGMGVSQLAGRLGVSQPAISSSIKLEEEGRITLNKLREIANALECDLVYGFVPRKKIEDIIRDQATSKTIALMEESETHMGLEDQKVMTDKNQRLNEQVEERIYSKFLWDK